MKRLLLIHCGGTLGMVQGENGYTTKPGNLRKIICSNPNISSNNPCIDETNCREFASLTFFTPLLRNGIIPMVDLFEFPDIIDSSNASVKEYCAISEAVSNFYSGYDGFIIIHGTDTLSYAASFLCFMIDGLTVPVVFTGAMLPMVAKGSDGDQNLIGAIESCLLVEHPGVYVYFNGWLHHGARTTKISSESFDSFYSKSPVRIEDLAKNYNEKIENQRKKKGKPFFHTKMSSEIGIFKVFPSIHPNHLDATFKAYKAVILETYGSGTFPSHRTNFLQIIRDYVSQGGIVVNVSQCADGNVSDLYETNNILSRVGVVSARNMTTESAFAKLSLLVENYSNEVKLRFQEPFCGEFDEDVDTRMFCFNNRG